MRSPIAASGCLVAFVALLLSAGPASAQPAGSCALSASGGVGIAASNIPPVELSPDFFSTGISTGAGFTVGLGSRCGVTDRLSGALDLEGERLDNLQISRVLAGLEIRVLGHHDGETGVIYAGFRTGWGGTKRGTGPIPPNATSVSGGPTIGADLRLESPVSERFSFQFRGGWRATWVTPAPGPEGAETDSTRPFHSLPVTLGLTFRL